MKLVKLKNRLIKFNQILFPIVISFVIGSGIVTFTLLFFSSPVSANQIVAPPKRILLVKETANNIRLFAVSLKFRFALTNFSFISNPVYVPINLDYNYRKSLTLSKFGIDKLLISSNHLHSIRCFKIIKAPFGVTILTFTGFQVIAQGLSFTGKFLYQGTKNTYVFTKDRVKGLYSSMYNRRKNFCSTALKDPDLHVLLNQLMELEKLSPEDFSLGLNLSANLLFEGGFLENDDYQTHFPRTKRRNKKFLNEFYQKSKVFLSNPIALKTFLLVLALFSFFVAKKLLFPNFDFFKFLKNIYDCLQDPQIIDRYHEGVELIKLCTELSKKARGCLDELKICKKESLDNIGEFADDFIRSANLAKSTIEDLQNKYNNCKEENLQYGENFKFWNKIYKETGKELAQCKKELNSFLDGQNGKN